MGECEIAIRGNMDDAKNLARSFMEKRTIVKNKRNITIIRTFAHIVYRNNNTYFDNETLKNNNRIQPYFTTQLMQKDLLKFSTRSFIILYNSPIIYKILTKLSYQTFIRIHMLQMVSKYTLAQIRDIPTLKYFTLNTCSCLRCLYNYANPVLCSECSKFKDTTFQKNEDIIMLKTTKIVYIWHLHTLDISNILVLNCKESPPATISLYPYTVKN